MERTLELTRRAYADIDLLFAFVKERSGVAAAESWRNALYARLAKLGQMPEAWPHVDEPVLAELDVREFLFRRWHHVYRIWYRIDESVVRIHRVRHASQAGLSAEDI